MKTNNYHQATAIPIYENNYLQTQNHQPQNNYHQVQNIYQQQNNQFNLYQQNQPKNIFQQISYYKVQKAQMVEQQVLGENQMIQQNSKIQQKLNDQKLSSFTNPNIIQNQINNKVNEFPSIKKEVGLEGHAKPQTKDEIDELYLYESAICKIKFKTFENGEVKDCFGTGFFLEINDDKIPFRKALFTNNHILNKNSIEKNKEIIFDYCI